MMKERIPHDDSKKQDKILVRKVKPDVMEVFGAACFVGLLWTEV